MINLMRVLTKTPMITLIQVLMKKTPMMTLIIVLVMATMTLITVIVVIVVKTPMKTLVTLALMKTAMKTPVTLTLMAIETAKMVVVLSLPLSVAVTTHSLMILIPMRRKMSISVNFSLLCEEIEVTTTKVIISETALTKSITETCRIDEIQKASEA